MNQSDTRVGDFRCLAGENLTGLEGRMVVLTHDAGVAEAMLPAASGDLALFLLVEGGADGAYVTLRPIGPARNVRVTVKGSCNPGDVLVLADTGTAADKGKVRLLPSAGGTYRGLAIAEEQGAEGQGVLCRPALIGLITVAG